MMLFNTTIVFLKLLIINALTNEFLDYKTHFFIDFFTNFAIIRTVFATNNQFIPLIKGFHHQMNRGTPDQSQNRILRE